MISGILWVHQLLELCGFENIFKNNAHETLAKNRILQAKDFSKDIDLIFACWCGKKVDIKSILSREELKNRL